MADVKSKSIIPTYINGDTNLTKVRETNTWNKQLKALKKQDAQLKYKQALASRGGTVTPLWKAVPGDTRALQVLNSLHDDPMIDAFIRAAQLPPG